MALPIIGAAAKAAGSLAGRAGLTRAAGSGGVRSGLSRAASVARSRLSSAGSRTRSALTGPTAAGATGGAAVASLPNFDFDLPDVPTPPGVPSFGGSDEPEDTESDPTFQFGRDLGSEANRAAGLPVAALAAAVVGLIVWRAR